MKSDVNIFTSRVHSFMSPGLVSKHTVGSVFLEYTFLSRNKCACIGFEGDNRYIAYSLLRSGQA